jgi:5-methylcytosine-specific restriction endonuclease McrBC GTP-binding regulatory subunit McrB
MTELEFSNKGEWLKYLPNLGVIYTVAGEPRPAVSTPRYGYEDFIVGIHLENGNTTPRKGDLLKFCETAATEPDQNCVLILDEIIRFDLCQLLDEAFSALENRCETTEPRPKASKTPD